MNKLMLLLVTMCLLNFSNSIFSQVTGKKGSVNNQIYKQQTTPASKEEIIVHKQETSSEREEYKSLFEKLNGTFQFVITKEDYSPLLSVDLLKKIENARTEDSDVYMELDEFTKIFIPSRKYVNSNTFQKLETITYNLND
jgi:hypothetical protein